MKVREERILADRKLAKTGGQVDDMIAACWEAAATAATRGPPAGTGCADAGPGPPPRGGHRRW
jgi:hypothetical protein